MADRRVTQDTAILGANVADDDLWDVVDVSDSTDAATGTNKKIRTDEARVALAGGGDPTTMSRLRYQDTVGVANNGSGTAATLSFDDEIELVGSDVEVDGGDDRNINILTDGIYSITGLVYAGSTLGGSIITAASCTIYIGGGYNIDDYHDGISGASALDIILNHTAYFLAAGTVINLVGRLWTSGGDWDLYGGSEIRVQRVV